MLFNNDWGEWDDVRHIIYKEIDKPGVKILDVASGSGFATEKCLSAARIICLDISAQRLFSKNFKQTRNRSPVVGSLWNMPFRKNYFDVVLACHCFPVWDFPYFKQGEQIQETINTFIFTLQQNVKQCGQILLTTVNGDHWYYKNKNKANINIIKNAITHNKLNCKIYGWRDCGFKENGYRINKMINKILALYNLIQCQIDHRKNFESMITSSSKAFVIKAWK